MACERVFLGWDSVPLEAAREWLVRRGERVGPSLDLSNIMVCVPTARAGRLLMNVLVASASGTDGSGALMPPTILTPGALVKTLEAALCPRDDTRRAATTLEVRLAWRAALARLRPDELGAIRGGMVFDDEEPLALATIVERSHARLTSRLTTFGAARRAAGSVHGGSLEARLSALANAELEYARILGECGRRDAAYEMARWEPEACEEGGGAGESELPWRRLVLAGVADFPPPLRGLLRRLDSVEITALVFAPAPMGESFDEFGGVASSRWAGRVVDLGRASIRVVDTPDDLVDASLEAVGALPAGTRTSDVVLGVAEAALLPTLVRRAKRAGMDVRPATGATAEDSATATLLRSVVEFHREGTFREWGTLLRHPWFERAVLERWRAGVPKASITLECWLEELDAYVLEHLPGRVDVELAEDDSRETLTRALEATVDILGELAPELGSEGRQVRRRTVWAWSGVIREFLERTVPSTMEDTDGGAAEVRAFEEVFAAMDGVEGASALDLVVGADAALRLVLDLAGDSPRPGAEVGDAVEAVGWLELPMDPAAHAVVVGLAEGIVPSRDEVDPLLPPAVCRALGVEEPSRREARDAYLLTLLTHSRRSAAIVVSRTGADGEAALPSRLLFRAEDAALVDRARLWSRGSTMAISRAAPRDVGDSTEFRSMPVAKRVLPDRWRVTAFKDYLKSPYLFYLRHVEGVSELDPVGLELLPHRFGTLVHDVLRHFGGSPERELTDERRISGFLRERFEHEARRLLGPSPSAPLWMQAQQALARLEGFASLQAQRARAGWRIAEVEWQPGSNGVAFAWEGGEIRLTGRIDRVDVHEELGVALVDYKTGSTGESPEKTHRTKAGWIDLQLPLYRHLAAELLAGKEPVLAYLTLAGDGRAQLQEADWDPAMLDTADETARGIVKSVYEGKFQIPGRSPPTGGVLGALAGLGFLGEIDGADDENGEEDSWA